VAFCDGQKVRRVNVTPGNKAEMERQLQRAKIRLGLPATVRVVSCYEAGREGFWVHRFLQGLGVESLVVDPASIEVNRKQRRVKTDRLDAEKLVRMLRRWLGGERTVWKVVRVPSVQDEDERRVHRERRRLKNERTAHLNRMRALLFLQGATPPARTGGDLARCLTWAGQPLPAGVLAELQREQQRVQLAESQLAELDGAIAARLETPRTAAECKAQKLLQLRAIGPVNAWVLSKEIFGWREIRNPRQLGALVGLTGTPYASGQSRRDQGISKAGNVWVRSLLIELAWGWLRFQPESVLAQWYQKRFAGGGTRLRRIGIVALARKLLIALWRYVEHDQLPAGAILKAT
jgi:transposase